MADIKPGQIFLGVTCKMCFRPTPWVEIEEGDQLGETGGEITVQLPDVGRLTRVTSFTIQ